MHFHASWRICPPQTDFQADIYRSDLSGRVRGGSFLTDRSDRSAGSLGVSPDVASGSPPAGRLTYWRDWIFNFQAAVNGYFFTFAKSRSLNSEMAVFHKAFSG